MVQSENVSIIKCLNNFFIKNQRLVLLYT
jgi:hypothetical protein